MKTSEGGCVHASRGEPCWGPLQVAVAGVVTCAGHYYVEATGGRYVAQGERHAFASKIAAMRADVFVGVRESQGDAEPANMVPAPKLSGGRKAVKVPADDPETGG